MTVSSALPATAAVDPLSAKAKVDSATASADRFLKLLVAQMQNQDPLSPMDNAQVTSQMAQINTVSGIEKLNATVQSLSGQFMQMQVLQGANLVGRDVIVPGSRLSIIDGVGQGGYQIDAAADSVKVEVLSASGQVLDTLDLGAQGSGMHSFDWAVGKADTKGAIGFRVTAKSGAATLPSTSLMRDRVDAVNTGGDALTLELQNSGAVAYSVVKSFN